MTRPSTNRTFVGTRSVVGTSTDEGAGSRSSRPPDELEKLTPFTARMRSTESRICPWRRSANCALSPAQRTQDANSRIISDRVDLIRAIRAWQISEALENLAAGFCASPLVQI